MSAEELGLPLNPRVFAIMLAFSEGRAHGYEVKKIVERNSEGAIVLDAGSLYRSIAKLVDSGLVTESSGVPDSEGHDVRRRYYELSTAGRELLAAEAGRLAVMVDRARSLSLIGREAGQ